MLSISPSSPLDYLPAPFSEKSPVTLFKDNLKNPLASKKQYIEVVSAVLEEFSEKTAISSTEIQGFLSSLKSVRMDMNAVRFSNAEQKRANEMLDKFDHILCQTEAPLQNLKNGKSVGDARTIDQATQHINMILKEVDTLCAELWSRPSTTHLNLLKFAVVSLFVVAASTLALLNGAGLVALSAVAIPAIYFSTNIVSKMLDGLWYKYDMQLSYQEQAVDHFKSVIKDFKNYVKTIKGGTMLSTSIESLNTAIQGLEISQSNGEQISELKESLANVLSETSASNAELLNINKKLTETVESQAKAQADLKNMIAVLMKHNGLEYNGLESQQEPETPDIKLA